MNSEWVHQIGESLPTLRICTRSKYLSFSLKHRHNNIVAKNIGTEGQKRSCKIVSLTKERGE